MSRYTIVDEPSGGLVNGKATSPHIILFASMLAGAWLAWPWYIYNTLAMGSPTRRAELTGVAVGVAGSVALALLGASHVDAQSDPLAAFRYWLVALAVWKAGVAYWVTLRQDRCYAIHRYYSGVAVNALPVVAVGYVLRGVLLTDALPLWVIMVLA